jgi:hypothetical protein
MNLRSSPLHLSGAQKTSVAGAGSRVIAVTINVGGGCAIWDVMTRRSISILKCIVYDEEYFTLKILTMSLHEL